MEITDKTIRRIVKGVVRDVMNKHPDYVVPRRRGDLAASLAKRLTGQLRSAEKARRETSDGGSS